MADSFQGEMLCVFLLILINGRIFFSKHKNSITIAALAPVVLVVSIFQFLAQGCSFFEISIFVISLFTFLANIHSFSRFISHLYVDRYRPAFYIFSMIMLLLTLLLGGLIFYFREVPVESKDFGVIETKERLSDKNAVLFTFEEPSEKNDKPVILFSTDKRSDVSRYRPYLVMLAKRGFKIYAVTLFDPTISYFNSFFNFPVLRRSTLIFCSLYYPEDYELLRQRFLPAIEKEYELLRKIAVERNGNNCKMILIGDSMHSQALPNLMQTGFYEGSFMLSEIDRYSTKGYGCVNITAPFLAFLLKEKRNASMELPAYMALCTEEAIQRITEKKPDSADSKEIGENKDDAERN